MHDLDLKDNRLYENQLYKQYPSLEVFFPFQIEKTYNPYPHCNFFQNSYHFLSIIIVFYLLGIYITKEFMKKCRPFNLKYTLATWNLLLSLFSLSGTLRTAPHLFNLLFTKGYYYSLCTRADISYGFGPSGSWITLFVYSKIPELLDTFFIVLRKKELIFLHWYHHITVLVLSWNTHATRSSTGLFFASFNFFVHALMYGYYGLVVLRMVPQWFNPIWITLLQLLQMIVGVSISLNVYYLYKKGISCNVEMTNLILSGFIYFSYFLLFFKFLIDRYFTSKKQKTH